MAECGLYEKFEHEVTPDLDRLPFPDCSLPGCDGYAEDGEKYCKLCLEALLASAEEAK